MSGNPNWNPPLQTSSVRFPRRAVETPPIPANSTTRQRYGAPFQPVYPNPITQIPPTTITSTASLARLTQTELYVLSNGTGLAQPYNVTRATRGMPIPTVEVVTSGGSYLVFTVQFDYLMSGTDHFIFTLTNQNNQEITIKNYQQDTQYLLGGILPGTPYTLTVAPNVNGITYPASDFVGPFSISSLAESNVTLQGVTLSGGDKSAVISFLSAVPAPPLAVPVTTIAIDDNFRDLQLRCNVIPAYAGAVNNGFVPITNLTNGSTYVFTVTPYSNVNGIYGYGRPTVLPPYIPGPPGDMLITSIAANATSAFLSTITDTTVHPTPIASGVDIWTSTLTTLCSLTAPSSAIQDLSVGYAGFVTASSLFSVADISGITATISAKPGSIQVDITNEQGLWYSFPLTDVSTGVSTYTFTNPTFQKSPNFFVTASSYTILFRTVSLLTNILSNYYQPPQSTFTFNRLGANSYTFLGYNVANGLKSLRTTYSTIQVGEPSPPTNLVGVGGNHYAGISFTPPAIPSARPTSYLYTDNYGTTYTSINSNLAIKGLADGTAYTYTIRSFANTAYGPPSAPITVTPTVLPPTDISWSVSNYNVTLSLTAPAGGADFYSAINNYGATVSTSPYIFVNLSANISYYFTAASFGYLNPKYSLVSSVSANLVQEVSSGYAQFVLSPSALPYGYLMQSNIGAFVPATLTISANNLGPSSPTLNVQNFIQANVLPVGSSMWVSNIISISSVLSGLTTGIAYTVNTSGISYTLTSVTSVSDSLGNLYNSLNGGPSALSSLSGQVLSLSVTPISNSLTFPITSVTPILNASQTLLGYNVQNPSILKSAVTFSGAVTYTTTLSTNTAFYQGMIPVSSTGTISSSSISTLLALYQYINYIYVGPPGAVVITASSYSSQSISMLLVTSDGGRVRPDFYYYSGNYGINGRLSYDPSSQSELFLTNLTNGSSYTFTLSAFGNQVFGPTTTSPTFNLSTSSPSNATLTFTNLVATISYSGSTPEAQVYYLTNAAGTTLSSYTVTPFQPPPPFTLTVPAAGTYSYNIYGVLYGIPSCNATTNTVYAGTPFAPKNITSNVTNNSIRFNWSSGLDSFTQETYTISEQLVTGGVTKYTGGVWSNIPQVSKGASYTISGVTTVSSSTVGFNAGFWAENNAGYASFILDCNATDYANFATVPYNLATQYQSNLITLLFQQSGITYSFPITSVTPYNTNSNLYTNTIFPKSGNLFEATQTISVAYTFGTGPFNGGTYTYNIAANANGVFGPSTPATLAMYTVPPTNPFVTVVGTTATVSFTQNVPSAVYVVTNNYGKSVSAAPYAFTNLLVNTSYTFSVVASNGFFVSASSTLTPVVYVGAPSAPLVSATYYGQTATATVIDTALSVINDFTDSGTQNTGGTISSISHQQTISGAEAGGFWSNTGSTIADSSYGFVSTIVGTGGARVAGGTGFAIFSNEGVTNALYSFDVQPATGNILISLSSYSVSISGSNLTVTNPSINVNYSTVFSVPAVQTFTQTTSGTYSVNLSAYTGNVTLLGTLIGGGGSGAAGTGTTGGGGGGQGGTSSLKTILSIGTTVSYKVGGGGQATTVTFGTTTVSAGAGSAPAFTASAGLGGYGNLQYGVSGASAANGGAGGGLGGGTAGTIGGAGNPGTQPGAGGGGGSTPFSTAGGSGAAGSAALTLYAWYSIGIVSRSNLFGVQLGNTLLYSSPIPALTDSLTISLTNPASFSNFKSYDFSARGVLAESYSFGSSYTSNLVYTVYTPSGINYVYNVSVIPAYETVTLSATPYGSGLSGPAGSTQLTLYTEPPVSVAANFVDTSATVTVVQASPVALPVESYTLVGYSNGTVFSTQTQPAESGKPVYIFTYPSLTNHANYYFKAYTTRLGLSSKVQPATPSQEAGRPYPFSGLSASLVGNSATGYYALSATLSSGLNSSATMIVSVLSGNQVIGTSNLPSLSVQAYTFTVSSGYVYTVSAAAIMNSTLSSSVLTQTVSAFPFAPVSVSLTVALSGSSVYQGKITVNTSSTTANVAYNYWYSSNNGTPQQIPGGSNIFVATYGASYQGYVYAATTALTSVSAATNVFYVFTTPPPSVNISYFGTSITVNWSEAVQNTQYFISLSYAVSEQGGQFPTRTLGSDVFSTRFTGSLGSNYRFGVQAQCNSIFSSPPVFTSTVSLVTPSVALSVDSDSNVALLSWPQTTGGNNTYYLAQTYGTAGSFATTTAYDYTPLPVRVANLSSGFPTSISRFSIYAVSNGVSSVTTFSPSLTLYSPPVTVASVDYNGYVVTATWTAPSPANTTYTVIDANGNYAVDTTNTTISFTGVSNKTYALSIYTTIKGITNTLSYYSLPAFTLSATPPSSVVASYFGTTITVTWSGATQAGGNAAAGYYVYDTRGSSLATAVSGAARSATLTGNQGNSYTFAVTASYKGIISVSSAAPTIQLFTPPPANVLVANYGPFLTISWTPVANAVGYTISQTTGPNVLRSVSFTTQTFFQTPSAVTTPSPAVPYNFTVTASALGFQSTPKSGTDVTVYTYPPKSVTLTYSNRTFNASWEPSDFIQKGTTYGGYALDQNLSATTTFFGEVGTTSTTDSGSVWGYNSASSNYTYTPTVYAIYNSLCSESVPGKAVTLYTGTPGIIGAGFNSGFYIILNICRGVRTDATTANPNPNAYVLTEVNGRFSPYSNSWIIPGTETSFTIPTYGNQGVTYDFSLLAISNNLLSDLTKPQLKSVSLVTNPISQNTIQLSYSGAAITISWADALQPSPTGVYVPPAGGYTVYVNTQTQPITTLYNLSKIIFTGVPGNTYQFEISVTNSNVASQGTLTPIVTLYQPIVRFLTVTNSGDGRGGANMYLSWLPDPAAAGASYVSTLYSRTGATLSSNTTTGESAVFNGAMGSLYYFSVVGISKGIAGLPSTVQISNVRPVLTLFPLTNLASNITVNYTADVFTYFDVCGGPSITGVLSSNNSTTVLQGTTTTGTGTTYTISVTAYYNGLASLTKSSNITLIQPSAPTNLSFGYNNTLVTTGWTAGANTSSYTFYAYDLSQQGSPIVSLQPLISSTTTNFQGIVGHTYSISIYPFSASNIVGSPLTTVSTIVIPAIPATLTASNYGTLITATWSPVSVTDSSGIVGYAVYASNVTNPNLPTSPPAYVGITTSSTNFNGAAGQTYNICVYTISPSNVYSLTAKATSLTIYQPTTTFVDAATIGADINLLWSRDICTNIEAVYLMQYSLPNIGCNYCNLLYPNPTNYTGPSNGWVYGNIDTAWFSPSATVPGCTLWLDAKDPNATGIPAANGATITTWKDKSGLANNAAATGTLQYTTPLNTVLTVPGGATASTVTVTVIGGGGGSSPYYTSYAPGGNGAVATYTFTNVTVGTTISYFVGRGGAYAGGGGWNSYVTIGSTKIYAGGGGGAVFGQSGQGDGGGGSGGYSGSEGSISSGASAGTRIEPYGNGGFGINQAGSNGIVLITMQGAGITSTINSTGLNGRPSMNFTGGGSWFAGPNVNTTSNLTVFAVYMMSGNSPSSNARIVSLATPTKVDSSSYAEALALQQPSNTTAIGTARNTASPVGGTNNLVTSTDTSTTSNVAYIAGAIYSTSSTQTLLVNGSSKATNATTGTFGYTSYGIGNYANAPSASAPFVGKISEVLIYSNALTPVQRAQVENYLSQKWGVTVTSSALTHDPRYNYSQTGTYISTGNYNSFTITSNIATLGGTAYIIGATPIHNNITGPTTYSDGANPVYLYKPTQPSFLNVSNVGFTLNINWGLADVLTPTGLLQNVRDYIVEVSSPVSAYPPVTQWISGFSNTTVTGFTVCSQILTISVTALIPLGGVAGYSNPIYGYTRATNFGIPDKDAITLAQNNANPKIITAIWPAGGPLVAYYNLFYLNSADPNSSTVGFTISQTVSQSGIPPTATFTISALGYPYTVSGAGYNLSGSNVYQLGASATYKFTTFAPVNLSSSYNGTSSITLRWDPVVDADYYYIQGAVGSEAAGYGKSNYRSTSLQITKGGTGQNLVEGGKYIYYISAYTFPVIVTPLNPSDIPGGLQSPFSSTHTTTLATPTDSPNSAFTASQNGSIVTLNWAAPTNVPVANTTYTIASAATSGTSPPVQTINSGTTVTTTVNITPGKQYTFTKTATCFAITGAQQQILNFQTYDTGNVGVTTVDLGTAAVRATGTGGNQGGTWTDSEGIVVGSGSGFTKDYTGLTKGSTFNKSFTYAINGISATITPAPITLANPVATAATEKGTGASIRLVLSALGTVGTTISWSLSVPAGLTGGVSQTTGNPVTLAYNAPPTGINTRYTFSNIVVSNDGFSSPPISVQYTTPNIVINTPTLTPDTNANLVLSAAGTIRPPVPVPASIRGSILWLDGADPNGDGSASPATVSVWKDKSGNGNNATSQNGTVQVVSNGLSFDGAINYLTVPGIAGKLKNTPFVVFAVESYDGTGDRKGWYFGDDAGGVAADSLLTLGYRQKLNAANGANGAYTMSFWSDDLNDTKITPTSPLKVPRVWTNYLPLSTFRNIRLNGAVEVTHTNSNRLTSFSTPVVGRAGEAAYYYKGVISELLVFNSDIGLVAIQDIETYLLAKWSQTTVISIPAVPSSWTFPTTITRNSGDGGNLPITGGTVPTLTYGQVKAGAQYQADANTITAFYDGYQTTYTSSVSAGTIPVVTVASAAFTTNGDGSFTLTVTATGVPTGGVPTWTLPAQAAVVGVGTPLITTDLNPTGTSATAKYTGGAAGKTYQIPAGTLANPTITVAYNGITSATWGVAVTATTPNPFVSSASATFFGCVEDFNQYKPNATTNFPPNTVITLATTQPTITFSPVGNAAGSMPGAKYSWTVPTPTGLTLSTSLGTTTLQPTFTYTGGQKFYNGNPTISAIASTATSVTDLIPMTGGGNYIMQFNLQFLTNTRPSSTVNLLRVTTTAAADNPRYPGVFVAGANDTSAPGTGNYFSVSFNETADFYKYFGPFAVPTDIITVQIIQYSGQCQVNVYSNGLLFDYATGTGTNHTTNTYKLFMPGAGGSAGPYVAVTNFQYVVDGATISPSNITGTGGMGKYAFSGIVLKADGFSSTASAAAATIATPLYSANLTAATISTNQSFFGMTLQAQGGIPAFTGSDGFAYTCVDTFPRDNNYKNILAISTATTANLGSTAPSLSMTYTLAVGVQMKGVVGPLIEFFGLANVKDVTGLGVTTVSSPQTADSGEAHPKTGATIGWTKPVLPAGADPSYYTYQAFVGGAQVGNDIGFGTLTATIPGANLTWGTTTVTIKVKYTFGTFTKTSSGVNTTITVIPKAEGEYTTAGETIEYIMPPGNYSGPGIGWTVVSVYIVGAGAWEYGDQCGGCYGSGGGGGGGYVQGTFNIQPYSNSASFPPGTGQGTQSSKISGKVGSIGSQGNQTQDGADSYLGWANIATGFYAKAGQNGWGCCGLTCAGRGGNGGEVGLAKGLTGGFIASIDSSHNGNGGGEGKPCWSDTTWRSGDGGDSFFKGYGQGRGYNHRDGPYGGYVKWSY